MRHIDELDREFVDIKSLSEVLGYSQRHIKRLVRTKNWVTTKKGRRFVLVEDILKTHPEALPKLTPSRDKNGTKEDIIGTQRDIKAEDAIIEYPSDVPNVPQKGHERDILYQKTVSTVQKLEKTIAGITYIANDTQKVKSKVDELNKKVGEIATNIKKPSEHRVVTILKILALTIMILGLSIFYFYFIGFIRRVGF